MSCTYIINGYVDVRIILKDRDVHASQSSTPEDIAGLIKLQVDSKIGSCEIVNHKIMIEEIG